MIRRGGSILAIVSILVFTSACGASSTPTPSSPTPGPTATENTDQTPAALEWSVGDPADPPTLLDPLPDRLVGDVGPLGNAVYRGGEVRRGAGGRPGLILGYLDGTHRILVDLGRSPRWEGMPIVSASRRGIVVAVVEREHAWGLQAIDVDRGEVRQLFEFQVELWDAVINPEATEVYWFVGGSGTWSGVWRMRMASRAIDRVLEPDPVAWAGGNTLAAAVRPGGQLAVSDDGRLAVLECYHDCRLRIVDLATDEYEDLAGSAVIPQELLGFVPAGVSLWGGCVLLPSGEVRDNRCPDPDGAVAALEAQDAMGFHVELPVGWILDVDPVPDAPIMSFATMALAVSSETGERIQLRVLRTLHGQ